MDLSDWKARYREAGAAGNEVAQTEALRRIGRLLLDRQQRGRGLVAEDEEFLALFREEGLRPAADGLTILAWIVAAYWLLFGLVGWYLFKPAAGGQAGMGMGALGVMGVALGRMVGLVFFFGLGALVLTLIARPLLRRGSTERPAWWLVFSVVPVGILTGLLVLCVSVLLLGG